MLVGTFNVLADEYTPYGQYDHAPAGLMERGARTSGLVSLIRRLGADVMALQEVERPLYHALRKELGTTWSVFWTQKENAPDGCATLVRKTLQLDGFESRHFADDSGYPFQVFHMGNIAIANTHLQWEMPNRTTQARELLDHLDAPRTILLADSNDRPHEQVRQMVAEAGFENVWGDAATAYIANQEGLAAIDLLAVRGLNARPVSVDFGPFFDVREIPSQRCPSDHRPMMARIDVPMDR